MNSKKPILISGIQPTGKLHLGNYLGALKNFAELQNSNKYQCLFFVADLHSINKNFHPREKTQQTVNVIFDFLASGIDFKKSLIFVQSSVPGHSELATIFSNFTPLNELHRMIQFKEKIKNQSQNVNAGLLFYPVLMASDIFLYNAKYVPIGEDQNQHLEFARTLARKFNARFSKTFIEPNGIYTSTPRLMDLNTPTKKMSKSYPSGCIFLDDSPKKIEEKIMQATTDSEKEIKYKKGKPGISNLLLLLSALSGKPIKILEGEYETRGYKELKKDLIETTSNTLQLFQKRRREFIKNSPEVLKNIKKHNKKASFVASQKIKEVKRKIGLFD